jgi:hypothetical protein
LKYNILALSLLRRKKKRRKERKSASCPCPLRAHCSLSFLFTQLKPEFKPALAFFFVNASSLIGSAGFGALCSRQETMRDSTRKFNAHMNQGLSKMLHTEAFD